MPHSHLGAFCKHRFPVWGTLFLKSSPRDSDRSLLLGGPAARSCRGDGFIRAGERFQQPDASGASQLHLVPSSLLCPDPFERQGWHSPWMCRTRDVPSVPQTPGHQRQAWGAREPSGAPGLPLGAASSLLWEEPGSLPLGLCRATLR